MPVTPINFDFNNSNRYQTGDLKVFHHHIYEYQKGIRNLILTTEKTSHQYYIEYKVNEEKINIFFGAKECVDVIKNFIHKKLNEFTPEQDFILGILLGYDRRQQCKRYLSLQYENNVLSFKK